MSDEKNIHEVATELARHEVQCEERWKTTFNRLDEIDKKLEQMQSRQLQIGGSVIVFLAGLVVTLALAG